MPTVNAFAAMSAGSDFEPYAFELGPLGPDHVDIRVESCGICHSDLSMHTNEWRMTQYPFVGGHEVIGRVEALGANARGLAVGDRVGVGWYAESCMYCDLCMLGDQHLCADAKGTISDQAGGFADRMRCHWAWAIPIPEALPAEKCGPLLCGGITVFSPMMEHGLSPTARTAVVGIGGLGHLAVKFLKAWGCEVTAISRTRNKEVQARAYGAHDFLATSEEPDLRRVAGRFDFILNTTNAALPWKAYVAALGPKGIFHTVGAGGRIKADLGMMITKQCSLSASPVGSVGTTRTMLEFCARHQILPEVEEFAMADINRAMARLKEAPARRVVLHV